MTESCTIPVACDIQASPPHAETGNSRAHLISFQRAAEIIDRYFARKARFATSCRVESLQTLCPLSMMPEQSKPTRDDIQIQRMNERTTDHTFGLMTPFDFEMIAGR